MKILKRLLPLICITGISLILSLLLYSEILQREENRCWQMLYSAAQSVDKEISIKLQDEVVKLRLLANTMRQEDNFTDRQEDYLYLQDIQTGSIFSRIEVLYPDGSLVSNRTKRIISKDISFEELVQRGEFISGRETDHLTGKDCLYYLIPVFEDDSAIAIMIGVINTDHLLEVLQPTIYDGNANCCIIDSSDGNFLMDSWHPELGNAYEMEQRKRLKEYRDVDLASEIQNRNTGAIAFESKTNGKNIYMYYTPASVFDWELGIFAQEDVIFGDLLSLQKIFIFFGITQVLLFVFYYLWNIHIVRRLERSLCEIQIQKEELKSISYRDKLTSMYNRHKYKEVLDSLKETGAQSIGIAYIDLNGLKQINDLLMHEAGDCYICRTAERIMQLFPENSYRIGGDEFVILVPDIEQNIFSEKILQLEKSMQQAEISISLGTTWAASCSDLNALLKEAEKQMYQNKKAYYMTHDRRHKLQN